MEFQLGEATEILTLNEKREGGRYFSSKMGLFGNNKEFQFGTCGLMMSHTQVQRTKERNAFFMDLGGRAVNEKSIGRN